MVRKEIDLELAGALYGEYYDRYIDSIYFRQDRKKKWKHRKNTDEYSVLTVDNMHYKMRADAALINIANKHKSFYIDD